MKPVASNNFQSVSMTGEVTSRKKSKSISKKQTAGQGKRFASCTDATQVKGEMMDANDDYLKMYGLDVLMKSWEHKLRSETSENGNMQSN
jgi:hypothetical protein